MFRPGYTQELTCRHRAQAPSIHHLKVLNLGGSRKFGPRHTHKVTCRQQGAPIRHAAEFLQLHLQAAEHICPSWKHSDAVRQCAWHEKGVMCREAILLQRASGSEQQIKWCRAACPEICRLPQPCMPFRGARTRCSSAAQGMTGSAQQPIQITPLRAWQAALSEARASLTSLGSCLQSAGAHPLPPACQAVHSNSASNLVAKANMPKQRAGALTVKACHTCQPIATSCPRQVVHVCPKPTTVIPLLQTALGRVCIAARHLPRQSS